MLKKLVGFAVACGAWMLVSPLMQDRWVVEALREPGLSIHALRRQLARGLSGQAPFRITLHRRANLGH